MGSGSVEKAVAQQSASHRLRRSLPIFSRPRREQLKDNLMELNWTHLAFKASAYSYILLLLWLFWAVFKISPFAGLPVGPVDHSGRITNVDEDLSNYFRSFEGSTYCRISVANLYAAPLLRSNGELPLNAYCNGRSNLLNAMSDGGRAGFDVPYRSRGCSHRWFGTEEICAILERFDGIIFIGDETLETIYAGFNILLRMDLEYGAVRIWQIASDKLSSCRCNSQFTNPFCRQSWVRSSDEVMHHVEGRQSNSFACSRTAHAMLRIDKSPATKETLAEFHRLVQPAPQSNYKPIPIIHSLTSSVSIELASESLTEFLKLADSSSRNTPMLWIGPTAAGHVEMKGRKGNQEIWYFAHQMAKISRAKDVETLGLWNLTVQAESWDGKSFSEEVSIVGAMMVLNWLAHLESS